MLVIHAAGLGTMRFKSGETPPFSSLFSFEQQGYRVRRCGHPLRLRALVLAFTSKMPLLARTIYGRLHSEHNWVTAGEAQTPLTQRLNADDVLVPFPLRQCEDAHHHSPGNMRSHTFQTPTHRHPTTMRATGLKGTPFAGTLRKFQPARGIMGPRSPCPSCFSIPACETVRHCKDKSASQVKGGP
jgi:hypothetical protein